MVVFFRVLRLKGKGILKPFNYIEAARIVEGEVKAEYILMFRGKVYIG